VIREESPELRVLFLVVLDRQSEVLVIHVEFDPSSGREQLCSLAGHIHAAEAW
jgi:hypothetical protein